MVDTPYIGEPNWGQDAIDAWNDLQTQITDFLTSIAFAGAVGRSNDGSFGLSVPTGTGLELIIDGGVLDDIQMDGNSL